MALDIYHLWGTVYKEKLKCGYLQLTMRPYAYVVHQNANLSLSSRYMYREKIDTSQNIGVPMILTLIQQYAFNELVLQRRRQCILNQLSPWWETRTNIEQGCYGYSTAFPFGHIQIHFWLKYMISLYPPQNRKRAQKRNPIIFSITVLRRLSFVGMIAKLRRWSLQIFTLSESH